MKKLILSIAILATFLTACSKKKDDPTPATTTTTTTTNTTTTPTNTNTTTTPTNTTTTPTLSAKETLLTQNTWHYTSATADKPIMYLGSTTASTDVYSQMGVCASDVDFTYSANKTGKLSGDCGGKSTANSIPFTWALTSNEAVLTITAAGQVNNWKILQLDATTLKVSYEDTDKNGLAYTQTDTYTKK